MDIGAIVEKKGELGYHRGMDKKFKIDNRVENCELIEFSRLIWFQGMLKEMRDDGALTLKNAIKDAFINPFAVWEKSPNEIMILDGHQRYAVMKKSGYSGEVPFFKVRCKDEKEAAKFVLYFHNKPGRVTDEGLYEFMNKHELAMDDFELNVDFQDIDLDLFKKGYLEDGEIDSLGEEWKGMPEFKQGDQSPFKTLTIHFKNEEDMDKFAKLINQKITNKTKYAWFPETKAMSTVDKAYVDGNE